MGVMIGRKTESQLLLEYYNSERAELVALYGRRRVGKTYLVNELFRDKMTFKHTGVSPADHEKKGLMKKQLESFYFSMIRWGMPEKRKPKSWIEAFFMLETWLDEIDDGSRMLLFFDELPWMDTQRSGFISAFENFWNGWACDHHNLMVIVCGSASSWVLDKLINNRGGLYNRVTHEMKLAPFTLRECEEFFEERGINLSRYDIVQSYMAVGGIPFYLGYFQKNLSLAQNIDALFFAERAPLRDEYNKLFNSIFDKPEMMKGMVRKLCRRNRGYSRGELLEAMSMEDGETFSTCLNALVSSEFVVKYIPFGNKGNDFHYKLTDPFCLFFLHFVENKYGDDHQFWLQNLESQAVVSWRGLAFETVCFNHIQQIKQALGISAVSSTQSAWVKKPDDTEGMQIDLLISRKDHIINQCEIKYLGDLFSVTEDYYRTLQRRIEALSEKIPRTTAVHTTLITTYGVKQNKYSGIFTDVLTIEDLFQ